jgi:hypothetical protein
MESPNFLAQSKSNQPDFSFSIKDFWLILLFGSAVAVVTVFSPTVLISLMVIVAATLSAKFKRLGLYLLIIFGVFIGFYFDLGNFVARDSILSAVNAPVVDFIGLGLLFLAGLKLLFNYSRNTIRELKLSLYPLYYYGFFIISAVISSLFVFDSTWVGGSLYYTLRFIIFSYFGFVFVLIFLTDSKEAFFNLLKVWFHAGLVAAVFGLSSLFVGLGEWMRVVPYEIFGVAPLKHNHNILAETLATIIPIGGFLAYRKETQRLYYLSATVFILLITLLSLSRAAWLTVLLELLVAVFFFKEKVKKIVFEYKQYFYPIIGVVSAVGIYMVGFLTSQVVDSSTFARLVSLDIVLFRFFESPLVGFGPGIYVDIIGQTEVYRVEFGNPLDAHGFIQKILLEQGMFGLITFGGFLLWLIWTIWQAKRKSSRKILMTSLLISVLAAINFQLYNTSYYNAHMWLPIGIALAGVKIFKPKFLSS